MRVWREIFSRWVPVVTIARQSRPYNPYSPHNRPPFAPARPVAWQWLTRCQPLAQFLLTAGRTNGLRLRAGWAARVGVAAGLTPFAGGGQPCCGSRNWAGRSEI